MRMLASQCIAHMAIALDRRTERLYDMGIPSVRMRSQEPCVPPLFAGVHIHSANPLPVVGPRLTTVLEENRCPRAMEKWCL
jgi:hypothetical protein